MRIRDCQSQQREADFVCFYPHDPGWNEGKDNALSDRRRRHSTETFPLT